MLRSGYGDSIPYHCILLGKELVPDFKNIAVEAHGNQMGFGFEAGDIWRSLYTFLFHSGILILSRMPAIFARNTP